MVARAVALITTSFALFAGSASADTFYGVTDKDQLETFTSTHYFGADQLPLKGLAAGEHIVSIDVRPATGGLYGVAQKGTALTFVRIDQATGQITRLGDDNQAVAPLGAELDFDPANDVAELILPTGSAVLFDPRTGTRTGLPAPQGGSYVALAYGPEQQGVSAFDFAVDTTADKLVLGPFASTGAATASGPLGISVGSQAALDLGPSTAFWFWNGSDGNVYKLDLSTGHADFAGTPSEKLTAFCVRLTGPVGFAAADTHVGEGDGTAAVVLTRATPADGRTSVHWQTADDSAHAGADYTASAGDVEFARDQTTATISVPISNDSVAEPTKRFKLHLTNPEGVPVAADATVSILDDDAPGGGGGGGGGDPTPTPTPSAQPTPTPGPTLDTTPPVVLGLPLTLKEARSLKLPFALSEPGSATVAVSLSKTDAKRLKLKPALATVALAHVVAGENRVTVKVSAKTLTALRKRMKLSATVLITATDAAGNHASRAIKLTLTRK